MRYVILYNIRSHYNVGAIFRTADAALVTRIFLFGHTPAPIDRFGRGVKEIQKTALGAEESVPWEVIQDCEAHIALLKASGVTVVAVEQGERSIDLYDFKVPADVAYIFGSETEGLPTSVIEACDLLLELPMRGKKESLNVSVTAGIVLYHR